MLTVRLLGAGTSSGVPRFGADGPDWGDCDPAEPRNRRTRAALLVASATTCILVDTPPDLRQQLLDAGCPRIDAVLWTHEHADHCHGIDDLRQQFLVQKSPIPAYARPECWRRLQQRFAYAWVGNGGYPPLLTGGPIERPLRVGDIEVRSVDMPHGGITTAGFTFSCGTAKVGYATDFQRFTGEMRSFFSGLDLFVVDALRRRPHPTHPHLDMTLDAVSATRPGRAVLMHMDSSMDYRTLVAELPEGVEPGYDGWEGTTHG